LAPRSRVPPQRIRKILVLPSENGKRPKRPK
jgi:hypothetical protein